MDGLALAYFRHFTDAAEYCEAMGKAIDLLASEG
jgi:hypothetical protein